MKRYTAMKCAKTITMPVNCEDDSRLMAGVIAFLILGLICANAFSCPILETPEPMAPNGPDGNTITSTTLSFDNIRHLTTPPNISNTHRLVHSCHFQTHNASLKIEPVTLAMMVLGGISFFLSRKAKSSIR